MEQCIERVLEIAKSQIGVSEEPKGSNWGPKIKEYLRYANVHSPAPWCVAFARWCFKQAHFTDEQFPVTASSTFLLNWAKEQGRLHKDPQPGDLFLLLKPSGTSAFHTGIVESVGKFTVGTIEGNSNSVGSPEGYEVVRRMRNKLWRIAFVRLT